MAPTPISLDSNLSTTRYRLNWDTTIHQEHLDPKTVGGHLTLNKRNSTPVGIGVNIGSAYNSINVQHTHHQTMTGVSSGEPPLHRSLERCHSEPLKPQVQPSVTSSSRYKTELCRPYAETGFCKYGEKCQFAHGGQELRSMPRHPKYKTELCRTFHTTGLCGYGTRCHFIHNAEERRNPTAMSFGGGFRGSDDDNTTPPASLQGSPTSPGGAFFGDTFSMISSHAGGLGTTPEENHGFPLLTLETPPVSPVESLAGDMESLSLSPTLSNSPSPPLASAHQNALHAFLDTRYLRLPIFESLGEAM